MRPKVVPLTDDFIAMQVIKEVTKGWVWDPSKGCKAQERIDQNGNELAKMSMSWPNEDELTENIDEYELT